MGSGLNFFANDIDITPGTSGEYVDVDISAHVPVGATGAIVWISEGWDGFLRKNGSSDDYYGASFVSQGAIIGLDANRVFEAKVDDHTTNKIWLIGYTDENVELFDNGIDKSTATTGEYVDVDVSGDGVAAGATGAIFFFRSTPGADYDCALRKNGSSDDIYGQIEGAANGGLLWSVSGLDASRVCEQKIETTAVDLKLIGYTKAPVTFFDNAIDKSLVSTGSWIDIDLTGDTEATADGVIFAILNTVATGYEYGLQHKDSTDDNKQDILTGSRLQRFIGLNSGQVCEGYIENTAVDFYVRGYCKPAVTEKTSSETGSGADAKTSGNPLATYSRSETGSGVEAMPARGITLPDSGSGVEHILDRIIFLTSEAGSGAETVFALLGKIRHETGTGVENSYLHILEGVKSSSDTGSGAEASSLAALFGRAETGEGVEAVVARAIYAKEYPTGAIDLARVLTATIAGAETGTGAEASLVAFYQKVTETGSGVDASTLEALFSRDDVGAGAEAITLLAAMVSHDTGVGVEVVIEYFRKLIDSGVGEENLLLVGFVGRALKTRLYTRPYYKTRLYIRPYYKTRLYTSEVKQ